MRRLPIANVVGGVSVDRQIVFEHGEAQTHQNAACPAHHVYHSDVELPHHGVPCHHDVHIAVLEEVQHLPQQKPMVNEREIPTSDLWVARKAVGPTKCLMAGQAPAPCKHRSLSFSLLHILWQQNA